MPTTSRFVFNPAVIPYLALGGAGVAEQLELRAKEIAGRARGIAPVDTGAFRDSIKAALATEGGTIAGRVSSDIRYATYLETGTSDTPAFHTLRTALEG